MLKKYLLPNLSPNSLFNEPNESASYFKAPRSSLTNSPNSGCEILNPLIAEANLLELEFISKNLFLVSVN